MSYYEYFLSERIIVDLLRLLSTEMKLGGFPTGNGPSTESRPDLRGEALSRPIRPFLSSFFGVIMNAFPRTMTE